MPWKGPDLKAQTLMRGTWGGPEHCKKINEHHITARKVDKTPSPQLFLAT